ncbi:MAG: MFS transporter [Planctomycetota bacterium]
MSQPVQKETASSQRLKTALRESVQPFIDLVHAPRALWGVNLAYVIEGMVYFGMLGYLAIHFSDFVFQGVEHADQHSHKMVMVLTAGITIAMFFLGFVADKRGVRFALISAFVLMLIGRILMSGAPTVMGLEPRGLWSPLHIVTIAGMLLVVIGYGMYMPAAYTAVRQFTTPKTAAMGFAMLYALMNLGGWIPTFAFLLRDKDFLGLGIPGTFWVYTSFTLVALVITAVILSKKTVEEAITRAKAETAAIKAAEGGEKVGVATATGERNAPAVAPPVAAPGRIPLHLWLFVLAVLVAICFRVATPLNYAVALIGAAAWMGLVFAPPTRRWLVRHPLANGKFFFFIFALIPVQTLFAYNWLILPQYISRAFAGWIGQYFEIASNANPILIFIAVPIITALTQKAKVYNMMIYGTFVMAAPAFLLTMGPYAVTLFAYILIMTIGEAMWQPRFLQFAAEIAPEGRTGEYMGVAQLPWFLTKVLVPWLYSGWMMDRYCPTEGPKSTEFMWLVFGCIAIASTILLMLGKPWAGKDFKTKAD